MMKDSVELKGLDSLLKKIESVKYEAKRKGGRFALRKAAQVMRDEARRGAQQIDDPATGRSIANNIVERWNGRMFKRTGDLGFRVGVQGGAVLPKKGEPVDKSAGAVSPAWRLVEFGTSKMRAQPFFRRAGERSAQRATDVFIQEFGKSLDRAIKKAGK